MDYSLPLLYCFLPAPSSPSKQGLRFWPQHGPPHDLSSTTGLTEGAIAPHCLTLYLPTHCHRFLAFWLGASVARGLPWWLSGEESACQCRRSKRRRFNPWVGKIPWRTKWQPTPVFLPGESRGRRSLAGYSSLGRQE